MPTFGSAMSSESHLVSKEYDILISVIYSLLTIHRTIPDSKVDEDVMLQFYTCLFPFKYFFLWLNHFPESTNFFSHREFAFTLDNGAYLRFQSFPTVDAFRHEVLRLNPSRFEIGPVYSVNPRERKNFKNQFKPVRKELVFDIDLTDYDDIRKCCQDKQICIKCWQFITSAIKVLDKALRDDFGFQHILWVYSGRRGAHAWVCDERAQELDDSKRRAIATYLQLSHKGKRAGIRRPLHPHLERSLKFLKTRFLKDILEDQDPWNNSNYADLLDSLPDSGLANALKAKWTEYPNRSSSEKWADIDRIARSGISKTLDSKALLDAKQDIIFTSMYPRLDIEVSKHLNHLLKSPFCVHPSTGRVCVPIDITKVDDFNPLEVPTAPYLLKEIEKFNESNSDSTQNSRREKIADFDKTSLAPYIKIFKDFTNRLVRTNIKEAKDKRGREENFDF